MIKEQQQNRRASTYIERPKRVDLIHCFHLFTLFCSYMYIILRVSLNHWLD